MNDCELEMRAKSIAIAVLVAVTLSGCGQTKDWIKGRTTSSSEEPEILGAQGVEVYVAELARIAGGDPAAQAEIYADAAAGAGSGLRVRSLG